jgi:hypothetical protein
MVIIAMMAAITTFAQVTLPDPVYLAGIDAAFDPDSAQVEGVERLRWRNTSSVPVDELQFHLYLNAFSSNRSTFMTESGGQLRGMKMSEEKWGWIEIQSMHLAYPEDLAAAGLLPDGAEPLFNAPFDSEIQGEPGAIRLQDGPDLKALEEIIQPDDGNTDDRTVARYPLPRPIQPGEWVEVEIAFTSQMPEIFARTGVSGDFVLGGQWFPKIGVFEDVGDRGRSEAGWNTHQFHADSEFFADFGNWDVRLTLPSEYKGKIGATGRIVEENVDDSTVTVHFRQPGVHDFAWTADPDFIVLEELFDPETDVPVEQTRRIAEVLGVSDEELRLQPVMIRLMLQPAHRAQARRYFDAAKAAIRGYGLRLGAYPYPTLTMVDPPRGGFGAGGMEYPTFITLGTHPLLNIPPLTGLRMPEMVTVHEFGHNFFQGMIASNEFEEAWIDEGINSYYEMVVMEESYGTIIEVLGIRNTPLEQNRLQLGAGRYTDPIVLPAWKYRSNHSYGLNSYARPAVTLRHLENLIGPETFHRAMRRFFQTWRFRHPTSADFEQIMQEATDDDISWFLEQAFHTDKGLDYRVRTATSRKAKERKGWFWEEGVQVLYGEHREDHDHSDDADEGEGGEVESDDDSSSDDADTEDLYRTEVVIERRGEFQHPVTIELVFDDGETLRQQWDGQAKWIKIVETRSARLISAEVDPDHLMVLDVDPLNNSRLLESNGTPTQKILVNLNYLLQNLFELTSILG